MHFDLIQSIGLAGDAATPNDDRAGTQGPLAWAIDGATDLGPPGLVGARGGAAWFAAAMDRALGDADDGGPVEGIVQAALARIVQQFDAERTRDPLGAWELPSAALIVARVAENAVEAAWLGDCVGLLRQEDGVRRLGEPARVKDKESALVASTGGHGQGGHRTRTAPVLSALRASRERSAVRVFGPDAPGPGNVRSARVPCRAGDDLVLMTDGFSALIDGYAALDAAGFADTMLADGLVPLAARLRAIEAEDGACTRYPRFKASDDATAIWVRVAGWNLIQQS